MIEQEDPNEAVAGLLAAAAGAYAASGHPLAVAAAALLHACPVSRVPPVVRQPPALADLGAALAALPAGPLSEILRDCAPRLPWSDSAFAMPGKLAGRYAYVDIAGPDGFSVTETIGFGLYLQRRETVYPAHSHAAEELYLVLSGTAAWQFDDGAFTARAPGSLIHHRPRQRHAMTTFGEPLITMWIWTGDLDESTYQIDGGPALPD